MIKQTGRKFIAITVALDMLICMELLGTEMQVAVQPEGYNQLRLPIERSYNGFHCSSTRFYF